MSAPNDGACSTSRRCWSGITGSPGARWSGSFRAIPTTGDWRRWSRDYPARGGKGIRPALVLATCQAFGGSRREAIAPAATIELLHNAFLIHDDVEDESELRRGRPTLHQLHGVPLAINAGDALAVTALAVLNKPG